MISSCFLNEIPLKPEENCSWINEVEILPSLKSLLEKDDSKKLIQIIINVLSDFVLL